jgi:hypothetical protein
MAVAAAIGAVELRRFASCGEDRRRKGDELGQLPQILGCGCQEELVFRSLLAGNRHLGDRFGRTASTTIISMTYDRALNSISKLAAR